MRKVPKNSIKISKCRRAPLQQSASTPLQGTLTTLTSPLQSTVTHSQGTLTAPLQSTITNRTDINFINAKEYINIVVMNGALRINDNQLILYSGTYNRRSKTKNDSGKTNNGTQLKVSFSGCPFTNKTLLLYVGTTTGTDVATALNEVSKRVILYTTPLADTITETVINEYKIDHYSTAILNVVKSLYSDSVQVCRVFVLATHDISRQKQYDQLATVLRATYNTDLIEVHDSQLAYGLLNAKREPLTIKQYCSKIHEMDIVPISNILRTVKIYSTELLNSVVYTKSKGSVSLRETLLSNSDTNSTSMIRIGLFHGVVSVRELYSVLKQNSSNGSVLLNELLRYAYAIYKFRYNVSQSQMTSQSQMKGSSCTLTVDSLRNEPKLKSSIDTINSGAVTAVATFVRKAVKCGYDRDTILQYLSTVVPDYDHSMYVYTYFGGKRYVNS